MMKTIISSVGLIVMFCGLAMGQAVHGEMFTNGPGPESMSLPPAGNASFFRARAGFGGPMARDGMRMHGRMGEWWKNPDLAQRIGLTDDQVQQLDKISYQSQLKMIDLRATVEKERLMLGHELQADHPSEDAVLGQVDKVSQARAAVERSRVQTMLSTRNVLTPEQWKKLKTSRMGFDGRSFERRGFRGQGRMMRGTPPPKP